MRDILKSFVRLLVNKKTYKLLVNIVRVIDIISRIFDDF